MPESLKTRMMGVIALLITGTLCILLVMYVGFSMYHQKTMTESEFEAFTAISNPLGTVLVMWFTSEVINKKS